MPWLPPLHAPPVIASRPAASRPGGAGKRFVVGDGRAAEPAAAADAAAPLGGVALLSLQSAAIAGRAGEHSETAAALGDLAALQLAVLRGKPMSLPELRGLAVRAERLADADAGGNAVAGALALRLRVEIARLEMPRTAGA